MIIFASMKNRWKEYEDLLINREKEGLFRKLERHDRGIDFTSNDYLGILVDEDFQSELTKGGKGNLHGASGSRLLSGNHAIHEEFEQLAAKFHQGEAALLFNSGYSANIGIIQALCGKEDVILSDELNHASIIDGITLSKAQKLIFKHQDLDDLEIKLAQIPAEKKKWIILESVYSMDGDLVDLRNFVRLAEKYGAEIILDEAHAGGVYGPNGEGLAVELGLEDKIFLRIITFGKAWGNHGAVAITSKIIRSYLVNFARSFIYSTALSPTVVYSLKHTLMKMSEFSENRKKLKENIDYFRALIHQNSWLNSPSAIQSMVCPGNDFVRHKADLAQKNGWIVKPIVYPTVPKGQERIRICLKANHSKEAIKNLIITLENEA